MRTNKKKVRTRFAPETSFELRPAAVVPYRVELENRFESLKRRLLELKLDEAWNRRGVSQIRRAANEAASLAWITPYPLLVFPQLFEEKAQTALAIADRQEVVRQQTSLLLCA